MTRSKIKGITVKAVEEEEGTAKLWSWSFESVPEKNVDNPFRGEIKALFHADTYKCWYGYFKNGEGNSYYTPEVKLNAGDAHEFEQKWLKAPESYPFISVVDAEHKMPGGFTWDSAVSVFSNSADQQAGDTGLPWIFKPGQVYKAAEGSEQTINWSIVNYGVAANIYVGLWDVSESKWLDAMENWAWVEAYATYSGSFTFTFHTGHTLGLFTYYWYNDQSNPYNRYFWITK